MLKSIDQAEGFNVAMTKPETSLVSKFGNTRASHTNVYPKKCIASLGIQQRWHTHDPFVSWKQERFGLDVAASQQDDRQENVFDLIYLCEKGRELSRHIVFCWILHRNSKWQRMQAIAFYVPGLFFVGTPTIIQNQECSSGDDYDNWKKHWISR